VVAGGAVRIIRGGWHRHPGVRSGGDLTLGERAADKMRNGMGSWGFVFIALGFLAVWMMINAFLALGHGHAFDPYPFILLNLVLSCVAALQGAILLIAAKRSDQVSSELAEHDYEADLASRALLETLSVNFTLLKVQHDVMHEQLAGVRTDLAKLVARLPEG
jgi:uncharacterized membrane protein